jgi:opacity protein-like surface antigen
MNSRWISKFTLGALALALMVPAVAGAQTSRLQGLSLMPDYVKDPSGTFSYPSQINSVGNYVYGELGNILFNPNTGSPITLDRQMGAVLGNLWDGRYGTWGIYLREETPALGQGDAFNQPNPGFLGGDPNQNTHESFDVIWGHNFGTTAVGLRVNRSFTKFEDEMPGVTTTLEFDPTTFNNDENLSRNIFGLGGGIGFEMNPETNVEVGLLYQTRTFENGVNPLGTRFEEDGPTTYQVAARVMWESQPNLMVVPVIKFYSFDLGNKFTTATTTASAANSLKGWSAGVAGNWTLGANDLFVLGATFAQNRIEQEQDIFGIASGLGTSDSLDVTETIAPNVFMALETNVTPWLTLRMGANKGVVSTIKAEDRTRSETLKFTDSPFSMNIGAGVKLGTLQLDAILNNVFPHTLGWLGSGIAGVYFPKVTATYSF